MKKLAVLVCLMFSLLLVSLPAYAQSEGDLAKEGLLLGECVMSEESFGFELKDYPIEHQKQALLNLSVKFRFIPEVSNDTSLYPDFVDMAEDIQKFLVDYPNETDYWEILNKNLVNFVMDRYTSIASLRIKVDVNPTTPRARYERYSVVTVTRPGQCPLIAQPST